jgi:hypothetical protein
MVWWGATYSDCGKDILQLVHQCDKPRVVHVDAVDRISLGAARGCLGHMPTHLGLPP